EGGCPALGNRQDFRVRTLALTGAAALLVFAAGAAGAWLVAADLDRVHRAAALAPSHLELRIGQVVNGVRQLVNKPGDQIRRKGFLVLLQCRVGQGEDALHDVPDFLVVRPRVPGRGVQGDRTQEAIGPQRYIEVLLVDPEGPVEKPGLEAGAGGLPMPGGGGAGGRLPLRAAPRTRGA